MRILFVILALIASFTTGSTVVFYNKLKHVDRQVRTISVSEDRFREKLQKAPPEWMMQQIAKDLAPFSSGITKQMLDSAFCGEKIKAFSLIRFTIQDGHIAFSHDEKHLYSRHFRELLGCIKKLNELQKLPNVDFLVSLEGGFEANPGIAPCFVFAKREEVEDLILIPDIKALAGYEKLRKMIPEANQKIDWNQKLAKGFWRGSTTGGYSTLTNWETLARTKLVLFSLERPEEIDARFNSIVQCDPDICQIMKAKGMASSSVTRPDHLKYKYLVDVDGNSCSYERFFWLLLCNSLVIKQVTPNI